MIYLTIFWIILITFLILYFLSKFFKIQKLNQVLEKEGALLFFAFLIPILLIAIITNDPIVLGGYEIPTEFQWLGSLFVSFFGTWQFYLKPLKNKVFGLDREIGEVKTTVKKVETDVNRLTDFLINKKTK